MSSGVTREGSTAPYAMFSAMEQENRAGSFQEKYRTIRYLKGHFVKPGLVFLSFFYSLHSTGSITKNPHPWHYIDLLILTVYTVKELFQVNLHWETGPVPLSC